MKALFLMPVVLFILFVSNCFSQSYFDSSNFSCNLGIYILKNQGKILKNQQPISVPWGECSCTEKKLNQVSITSNKITFVDTDRIMNLSFLIKKDTIIVSSLNKGVLWWYICTYDKNNFIYNEEFFLNDGNGEVKLGKRQKMQVQQFFFLTTREIVRRDTFRKCNK